jgi:hypothetical protein
MHASESTVVTSAQRSLHPNINQLLVRTRAEYLEMPGLALTIAQAARLFSLPLDVCTLTLDALVESGFLRKHGPTYFRAGSGSRGPRFGAWDH